MAAPINFGQIQDRLLAALWFLDVVGGDEGKKRLLAGINAELEKVEKEKADLELGRDFQTGLNRLKEEIGKAQGELQALLDEAERALADLAEETAAKRGEAQALLDAAEARDREVAAAADALTEVEAALAATTTMLDERQAELGRRADQLDDDRAVFDTKKANLDEQRRDLDSSIKDFAAGLKRKAS